jgi:hypothetical protein
MARARTRRTAGEFTCPECGKTFTRAASLGAHRRAAHGVAGAKAAARKNTRRTSRRGGGATAGASRARTSSRSTVRVQLDGIDRDALLSALFPNGIPPREHVIRAVNEWLAEGDRLATLR